MKHRQKGHDKKAKISISIKNSVLAKIDEFIDDEGLKKEKVNRSLFIEDVLSYVFDDFEKKKERKNSLLDEWFPE